MLGYYHSPPDQASPPPDQAGIPPDQAGSPLGPGTPPPEQSILGDTVNERAVCILLECNLVFFFGFTCVLTGLKVTVNGADFCGGMSTVAGETENI